MNIALIGYGKMGRAIEATALDRGHNIVLKIDIDNRYDFTKENIAKAQVAIEFTKPETAFDNVKRCLEFGVPVVSGSTGWFERLNEMEQFCRNLNGSMLCTSNFSLGVNVFFRLNKYLASIMNNFPSYHVELEETHHTQKLDAPSGTAITLAEGIIDRIPRYTKWELNSKSEFASIPVKAVRKDDVPGTHSVRYISEIDDIELVHKAHNRTGFAQGAVLAAEYIHDKKGVFSMDDLLGIG